jgi:hypothetical protein
MNKLFINLFHQFGYNTFTAEFSKPYGKKVVIT